MDSDDQLPIDPDLDPNDPSEPRATPSPVVAGRLTARRARPDVLGAIALGGAIGTTLRAALGRLFPVAAGHFPTTTLAINLIGSAVLGVLLVVLIELVGPTRRLRPFLVTGVLGGFTTFSTFMVETVQLGRHGHSITAVTYVMIATVGGVAAALGGIALGRMIVRRVESPSPVETADDVGGVR